MEAEEAEAKAAKEKLEAEESLTMLSFKVALDTAFASKSPEDARHVADSILNAELALEAVAYCKTRNIPEACMPIVIRSLVKHQTGDQASLPELDLGGWKLTTAQIIALVEAFPEATILETTHDPKLTTDTVKTLLEMRNMTGKAFTRIVLFNCPGLGKISDEIDFGEAETEILTSQQSYRAVQDMIKAYFRSTIVTF